MPLPTPEQAREMLAQRQAQRAAAVGQTSGGGGIPQAQALPQPMAQPQPQASMGFPGMTGGMKPATTTFRMGPFTQTFKVPEVAKEKEPKSFSSEQLTALNALSNTIQNLGELKTSAETGKFKTGPLAFRYSQLPFAHKYMGLVGAPEEAEFKSTLVDTQAAYMSAKTGAQRGFKEMQWLEAAMPSADLPPKSFVKVANRSIKRLQQNYINLINNAKKAGFDVSGFEDVEQPDQGSQQGGQSKQLDSATAAQFLQQAGGNKATARILAKKAGYNF